MGDSQPDSGERLTDGTGGWLLLNSAKTQRARTGPKEEKDISGPCFSHRVSRSPSPGCQAPVGQQQKGLQAVLPNNHIKHISSKACSSFPAGASTSPNTKTLLQSLGGHLSRGLRGPLPSWGTAAQRASGGSFRAENRLPRERADFPL